MSVTSKGLYRIMDANVNRTKEGLRVCEDIARYVWNKKELTRSFKDLRHALTEIVVKVGMAKLLVTRDVSADVGRPSSASEAVRQDVNGVFMANVQRVKESLRVLEEMTKLIDPLLAEEFKGLRYKVYVLEQRAFRSR